MKFLTAVFMIAAAPLPGACVPITTSRILAADLARAEPRFSALPPNLVAGFAPEPGATRSVPASQLTRLARSNGLDADGLADLCFEFPVATLNLSEVRSVMEHSLPAGSAIRNLTAPESKAPAGEIHFPADGLEAPGPGSPRQLWRGFVVYSGNRRWPVWATAEVAIPVSYVVAAVDFEAEAPIRADSVRLEARTLSTPASAADVATARRLEDVVGRASRVPVKAGVVIRASDLMEPPLVRRGDSVHVEVRSGLACLRFDAVAAAAARKGDDVELRNPVNGRMFRARVDSAGRAVLILPSGGRVL